VRAGSILPLGPVGQSTARLLGRDLDLLVYPGRDGSGTLYEDDGTSYRYERGASARVALAWEEASAELSIGDQRGGYTGMPGHRGLRVHRMEPGRPALNPGAGISSVYSGSALRLKLGGLPDA
jgi:alpha-D-xyloside xylohydrolase